jgi:uncharacterized surface protein with fasciclin (FAS1) repeats
MKRFVATLVATGLLMGVVAVPAVAADSSDDITTRVVESKRFDILEALVIEAGLAGALSESDPLELGDLTVFAPSDRAFRKLVYEYLRSNGTGWYQSYKAAFRSSEQTVADTIIAVASGALGDVLLYHVAQGAVPFSVAKTVDNLPLPMLNEDTVVVDGVRNRWVKLTDEVGRRSWVLKPDINASNGVIHGINRVLLPFELP